MQLMLFETEAPKTLGVFNWLSLEELRDGERWTELRKEGRTLTWPANGIQFRLCDVGGVAIIKENEKPVRKEGWRKDQGVIHHRFHSCASNRTHFREAFQSVNYFLPVTLSSLPMR